MVTYTEEILNGKLYFLCNVQNKLNVQQIPAMITITSACVCVCVCVYSFTVKASSVCKNVCDILEGTDQQSCIVSIILAVSAKFLHIRF